MVNPDIGLVPTKDLLDEIFSRFDHAIFSGMRVQNDSSIDNLGRWNGNSFACAGLAAAAQIKCLNDFEEKSRPLNPDEL